MIHRQTHPEYVEGCYACKISSVAMWRVETDDLRGVTAHRHSARKIKRDVEAYERARKSGLRPQTSTLEGVEKAEKAKYSEERALKRLGYTKYEEAVKPLKEVM